MNLICVEDGIDSSKESGKLTITVLSAVAEIERENILVQTMEGRRQKAREGKWNGGQAPYGYELDPANSSLTVNPQEAEVVRLIYEKFAYTDMGMERIADYLNQRGFRKKRLRDREIRHFEKSFIKKILDNPVYTGKIAYGKSGTEKVKGTRGEFKRVYKKDFLVAEGVHEAIVDDEVWDAVRDKRQQTGERWVKKHSLEHEHILSGILKCPVCGRGMCGTVNRKKSKRTGEMKDTFYYRCHRRTGENGKVCGYRRLLNQEKVDVSVLEEEKLQLQGQLQQVSGARDKLILVMGDLDNPVC